MVITIKVVGRERVTKYLNQLPRKMSNAIDEHNKNFMSAVQKSAKLRAPRDTGALANSISVKRGKKKGDYVVSSDSPYATFQEVGFKAHFAPILNSSKMSPGIYWVSKNTPFLVPALEFHIAKLNTTLATAANKGIK